MMTTTRTAAFAFVALGGLPGCYAQVPEDFSIAIRFEDACEADDGEASTGDTTTGGDTCTPQFFADGRTIARLLIDVPADTSKGKQVTVRTNLGVLDPSGADAPAKSDIVLTTLGEQVLITDLFVGSVEGQGIVTVEAEGLSDTAEFFVRPLTNEISITGPTTSLVADGRTLYDFVITLETETSEAQLLTVTSTLGKLNPMADGAEAFTREVSITRDEGLTVQLQAPTTAGSGQLRARFGDGPEAEFAYAAVLPSELVAIAIVDPPAEGYFADAETLIPIDVSFTSELDALRKITLKTSTGALDAATNARELDVMLRGGETARVQLLAGREFGPVLLTAAVSDDGSTSASFDLQYSPPTVLSLVAQESVLRENNVQTDLTAYFGRPLGEGRVSLGTRVEFATCCDPDGDGAPTACDEYVELQKFGVAASDGTDSVAVEASLTPTGETFVQTLVNPPVTDLLVTVHAYVLAPGEGFSEDCGILDTPTLPGVTAKDSTVLALRPATP